MYSSLRKFVFETLMEKLSRSNRLIEAYDDVPMEYIKRKKKLSEYTDYTDKTSIDGYEYLNFREKDHPSPQGDNWFLWGMIIVFDQDGTEVANSSYGKFRPRSTMTASIDVRPDKRRQGIASNIYQWIEKLTGETLHPDLPHSPSAKALWASPNRKFGVGKMVSEGVENCPEITVTDEMRSEVSHFKTDEEFLRSGGLSNETLYRAAFGFYESDIKTLNPNQINIKWKDDWENVIWEQQKSGLSKKSWSMKINLQEPIDVTYENDKFYLEDGHHRLFAAMVLNKPLKVNLEIKMNPITKLAPELSYDEFHRCLFRQVRGQK